MKTITFDETLWKLAPIEPTESMIDAAEHLDWKDEDVHGNCINQWNVMLEAAPTEAKSR